MIGARMKKPGNPKSSLREWPHQNSIHSGGVEFSIKEAEE